MFKDFLQVYAAMDKDGDGSVTLSEFQEFVMNFQENVDKRNIEEEILSYFTNLIDPRTVI